MRQAFSVRASRLQQGAKRFYPHLNSFKQDAGWRRAPATDKQLQKLKKMEVRRQLCLADSVNDWLTDGQVAVNKCRYGAVVWKRHVAYTHDTHVHWGLCLVSTARLAVLSTPHASMHAYDVHTDKEPPASGFGSHTNLQLPHVGQLLTWLLCVVCRWSSPKG